MTRVHPTEPAPEHPDRPAFDGLASRLARAIDPMLRPVTVAAVAVEDLDAIAVVHGADAVHALDAAWNERLRALAPAPAAVFAAGPGEAVVALPASTPDLRTAVPRSAGRASRSSRSPARPSGCAPRWARRRLTPARP